jgi:hypothetical protein
MKALVVMRLSSRFVPRPIRRLLRVSAMTDD